MKRTSLARRNSLLTPAGISLGAVAFLIALIVVLLRVLFPGALLFAAAPALSAGAAASAEFSRIAAGFTSAERLGAERDRLASEDAELSAEVAVLSAQIADLKGLAGAEARPEGIVAGVLARPPVAGYDVLLVDAGAAAVATGTRAYAPGGVPIGTVESVSGSKARIVLYSASGETTEGWVGSSHIPLTITGQGGGAFLATLPRTAGVAVGDTVYAPGPGALPIGTVARIEADPSSPTATLFIAPLVNLFSLAWVSLRP